MGIEDNYSPENDEEQTPEICLAAVQEIGWMIEYVENQSREICLAALQSLPYAIAYVRHPTSEMYELVANFITEEAQFPDRRLG